MPNPRERSPLATALAATVRAEAAARQWPAQELARRTGISYASIRRIESGERVIDVSQLGRFADAFGVEVSDLIRMATGRVQPHEDDVGDTG